MRAGTLAVLAAAVLSSCASRPADSGGTDTPSPSGASATAGECAGLEPSPPGTPLLFRTPDSGRATDVCAPATSDGGGALAFFRTTELQPHDTRLYVTDAAGNVLGKQSLIRWEPLPQSAGFLGVENVGPFGGFRTSVVDPTGALVVTTPYSRGGAVAAQNPKGGAVLWVTEGSADSGRVVSVDVKGSVKWSAPLTLSGTFAALAADRAGNVLILSRGDAMFGGPSLAGIWLTPDGIAKSPFLVLSNLPDSALSWRLFPRVNDGLFLQQVVPHEGGEATTWVRTLPALAARADPAPDFLAQRPDTTLHMARGGRAYALLPVFGQSSPTCTQTVELLAPSGTSCGTAALQFGMAACTTGALSVGEDGTVFQQLPKAAETCTGATADACTCSWQFWPRLLE